MEEWKDIPNRNHEISTLGNVRNKKTGRILKPSPDWRGYPRISLSNGTKQTPTIAYPHRLVALAFIPNPGNKPMVNHKNSNRADPTKNNLEWVTAKENSEHAIKNGRANMKEISVKANKASLLVNSKKVLATNVNTNIVQSFNSRSECSRSLGLRFATLSKVIDTGRELKGFVFNN